ncbi:hypothetical protein GCM10023196_050200 [Actinoallomurus vinaceus]|uniref:Uncharacterized protein n=1 Tax=Actinoallomurus vinaceus TaxID=1080074 RepID=A0ABP8UDL2_9ACTN
MAGVREEAGQPDTTDPRAQPTPLIGFLGGTAPLRLRLSHSARLPAATGFGTQTRPYIIGQ